MAKEAAPAPAATVGAPKNRTKLLLIVVVIMLLLVTLGGAGLFLLLSGNHDDDAADDEEEVTQTAKPRKKKAAGGPPVFSTLDPFTVNLRSEPERGSYYVQVKLVLELEDAASDATIKAYMPRIRHNVNMLLSDKTDTELLTREGKERLEEEIKDAINAIIEPPAKGKKPDGPVLSALFDSIIIQ
jgi:flagellar FliL protein